jgi:hypothetical protein
MRATYHCYRRARGVPGRALSSRDIPITLSLPHGVAPQSDSAWEEAKSRYAEAASCPLDQVEEDGCAVLADP